jgi:hypothetical protein
MNSGAIIAWYDYGEVLGPSWQLNEAQRSGKLSANNSIPLWGTLPCMTWLQMARMSQEDVMMLEVCMWVVQHSLQKFKGFCMRFESSFELLIIPHYL